MKKIKIFLLLCFLSISSLFSFQKNINHLKQKGLNWVREKSPAPVPHFFALYDKIIHKKPLLDAPAFRLNFSETRNPLAAIVYSFTYKKLKKNIKEVEEGIQSTDDKKLLKSLEKMIEICFFRYTFYFAQKSYEKKEYLKLIEFGLAQTFSSYAWFHNTAFFKAALKNGKFPRLKKLDTFIAERAAPVFNFSAPLIMLIPWIMQKIYNRNKKLEKMKKNPNSLEDWKKISESIKTEDYANANSKNLTVHLL